MLVRPLSLHKALLRCNSCDSSSASVLSVSVSREHALIPWFSIDKSSNLVYNSEPELVTASIKSQVSPQKHPQTFIRMLHSSVS